MGISGRRDFRQRWNEGRGPDVGEPLACGRETEDGRMAGGASEEACSRLSCQRSKERPHTGFGGQRKEQVLASAAHTRKWQAE